MPASAIDLIARSMRQAVDAYRDVGQDISNKPEILADLYQSSGYKEEYEIKAGQFAERQLEAITRGASPEERFFQ